MKLEEVRVGQQVLVRPGAGSLPNPLAIGPFAGVVDQMRPGNAYPVRIRIARDVFLWAKPEDLEAVE